MWAERLNSTIPIFLAKEYSCLFSIFSLVKSSLMKLKSSSLYLKNNLVTR